MMARKRTPAKRTNQARSITDQLRDVILARDLTDSQLGKLAEVDPGVIGRFIRRERDLSGPTIDRLCSALGLGLVETSRARGRPRERDEPTRDRIPRRLDRVESDSTLAGPDTDDRPPGAAIREAGTEST